MAYKIEWSYQSLADMQKVIEYLIIHWSYKIADEFEEITLSRLQRLSEAPLTGILSIVDENVRSILLTKHNRLYYRYKENIITVLNIFDTRQNPTKNKFEQED